MSSPVTLPSFPSQRALSQVLFLTPHLPAFFLRHRLRSHVLEIRHLDRAMLRLGLGQLSEEELKAVRTPPPAPFPWARVVLALPIVSGAASGRSTFLQTHREVDCGHFPPERRFPSPFSMLGPHRGTIAQPCFPAGSQRDLRRFMFLNVSVFFPSPQACYLRGLNSTHLGMSECRAWLEQWLGLSCKLQGTARQLPPGAGGTWERRFWGNLG